MDHAAFLNLLVCFHLVYLFAAIFHLLDKPRKHAGNMELNLTLVVSYLFDFMLCWWSTHKTVFQQAFGLEISFDNLIITSLNQELKRVKMVKPAIKTWRQQMTQGPKWRRVQARSPSPLHHVDRVRIQLLPMPARQRKLNRLNKLQPNLTLSLTQRKRNLKKNKNKVCWLQADMNWLLQL